MRASSAWCCTATVEHGQIVGWAECNESHHVPIVHCGTRCTRPTLLSIKPRTGDHHETSNLVVFHFRVRSRPPGGRQSGFSRLGSGHPSLPKAGHGHATNRRRQALPGLGGRTEQQQRHEPRVHETALAQARRRQAQLRLGGRFLGPDRTGGGQVRLPRAGRCDPRSTQSQPAAGAPLVRDLEERAFELPARLGEEGLRALPAPRW